MIDRKGNEKFVNSKLLFFGRKKILDWIFKNFIKTFLVLIFHDENILYTRAVELL
jgi:hypothetical protein